MTTLSDGTTSPRVATPNDPVGSGLGAGGLQWRVLIALGVTLVLWASAFVAIRHLGKDVPAGALSLGRLLVASIALSFWVFRRRPTWPKRSDWWLLVVCGVGWFGIYNLALNEAERRIDAGTAALIVQIGPLIVALLATVFLGERMTKWLLAGMVVGFAGSSSSRAALLARVQATPWACGSRCSQRSPMRSGCLPKSHYSAVCRVLK